MAWRAVGGKRRPLLPADLSRHSEPEPLQRALPLLEGLEEDPRGRVLPVVRVAVAAGAVGHPVLEGNRVGEDAAAHLAVNLETDVPVGHDRARQPAFDQGQVRVLLALLQAARGLELADEEAEGGREPCVQVGVLDHGLPATEVGDEVEVETLRHGAHQLRPHATQQKRIGTELALVTRVEASVCLGIDADAEAVVAAVGLDQDTVRSG